MAFKTVIGVDAKVSWYQFKITKTQMTDWCFVVSRPKNKYSEVIAIRMIEPFSLRIMGS